MKWDISGETSDRFEDVTEIQNPSEIRFDFFSFQRQHCDLGDSQNEHKEPESVILRQPFAGV